MPITSSIYLHAVKMEFSRKFVLCLKNFQRAFSNFMYISIYLNYEILEGMYEYSDFTGI